MSTVGSGRDTTAARVKLEVNSAVKPANATLKMEALRFVLSMVMILS